MKFNKLKINDCILIDIEPFHDLRGSFTKLFHTDLFRQHGITMDIAEQLFSISNKGALRGMHFQLPPHDHAKLLTCLSGKVLDVLLDLRRDSTTYGQYLSLELEPTKRQVLYIPRGIAHGFLSLEDGSGVFYSATSVHHPESDTGIHWNSFGLQWPIDKPIVSERDKKHPPLGEFNSPF